jgi:hypothetical protein
MVVTGQVEKSGDRPIAYGGFSDVFLGRWLGEEKVDIFLVALCTCTS